MSEDTAVSMHTFHFSTFPSYFVYLLVCSFLDEIAPITTKEFCNQQSRHEEWIINSFQQRILLTSFHVTVVTVAEVLLLTMIQENRRAKNDDSALFRMNLVGSIMFPVMNNNTPTNLALLTSWTYIPYMRWCCSDEEMLKYGIKCNVRWSALSLHFILRFPCSIHDYEPM